MISAKECRRTSWNCVRAIITIKITFCKLQSERGGVIKLEYLVCARKRAHTMSLVWPPVCLFAAPAQHQSEREPDSANSSSSGDIKYFCSLSCHSSCTKLDVWAQFMVNLLQECHSIKARAHSSDNYTNMWIARPAFAAGDEKDELNKMSSEKQSGRSTYSRESLNCLSRRF